MSFRMAPRALSIAALVMGAAAPLAAQTNTFVAGTQFVAPDIVTSFTTGGKDMVGMRVTWTFTNGSSSFDTWRELSPTTWGVSLDGFSVQNNTANTFQGAWNVVNGTNLSIASVRFNGALGRTVFDCYWTGTSCANTGSGGALVTSPTVGSAGGTSHTRIGGSYTGAVSGQYANLVGVGGAAPVGDLFEQLTITFESGLGGGQTYDFRADTDNTDFNAPPPTPVDEPATAMLLAFGALGFGLAARRRRA